jgi:hypothetical protein
MCIEGRAADAAERQATWAAWTVIVGGAGVVGIVITLLYTARAANSAKRGAKVAERALVDLERPYVFAYGISGISHFDGDWEGPIIHYSVGNFGRMPAIVQNAEIIVARSNSGLVAREAAHPCERLPSLFVIGTSGEAGCFSLAFFDYTKHLVAERFGSEIDPRDRLRDTPTGYHLALGQPDIIIRIIITYRGPFTVGHETSSCWALRAGEAAFQQYGGTEYNYWK